MDDLILGNRPYLPQPLNFSENPLTALAKADPDKAYDVMLRHIDLERREQSLRRYSQELSSVCSVCGNQSDQIRDWIKTRKDRDTGAEAVYEGEVSEGGFFFSRSARIRASSTFRIF